MQQFQQVSLAEYRTQTRWWYMQLQWLEVAQNRFAVGREGATGKQDFKRDCITVESIGGVMCRGNLAQNPN